MQIQTHPNTNTDRQAGRQADTDTHRQTHTQTQARTDRQADTGTHRPTHTGIFTDRQAGLTQAHIDTNHEQAGTGMVADCTWCLLSRAQP